MRAVTIVLQIFLLAGAGCQWLPTGTGRSVKTDDDLNKLSVYTRYAPAKINIMPLTEFIGHGNTQQLSINLYVSLLDSFGYQIKSPCVFRFELYQKAQRSAEPKGKRIIIWPEIDLTAPAANNEYWRDFLRGYEFNLPFELPAGQSYILQVTCLSSNVPSDRRLSAEFFLKSTK